MEMKLKTDVLKIIRRKKVVKQYSGTDTCQNNHLEKIIYWKKNLSPDQKMKKYRATRQPMGYKYVLSFFKGHAVFKIKRSGFNEI